MSYEGRNQNLCENGHLWEDDCYDESDCPVCKGETVFENCVDDTNCEAWGEILPEGWSTLEWTPEESATCDLGHPHVLKHATYREPTPEELENLRMFWDGNVWQRCSAKKS